MGNKLVSIIIPVYNSMPYLRECLESVEAQTYQDFEVLCIDDGSTDDSYQVLNEYAQRDARFKVLHQENMGAAVARNRGIDEAQGEYLFFSDADDTLHPELLEKTVARAKKTQADIVLFGYNKVDEGEGAVRRARDRVHEYIGTDKQVFNIHDTPDKIFLLVHHSPWNKLFRRSFVLKEALRFQNLKNSNDYLFCQLSLAVAKSLTYIDEPLYNYRRFHNSVTNPSRKANYLCGLEACLALREELTARGLMNLAATSWRVRTVGIVGSRLINQTLCQSARIDLLKRFSLEAERDQMLLSMPREAYEPYTEQFDVLTGGIQEGLPLAGRLENTGSQDVQEEMTGFTVAYKDFEAYLSCCESMRQDQQSLQGLLDQAELALSNARDGYAKLSSKSKNAVWGLPDDRFSLFMHLVYDNLRDAEQFEKDKIKIEDLKQRNEEKKQQLDQMERRSLYWRIGKKLKGFMKR